ncbi:diaminopimelate decarboxylase [Canibacter zhoujuaniae]|uniref:diaminopimelate decarboxylase n=1 Tax=Canibacter zhoujuaniae TaxID=2708343 RepID=UPI00141E4EE5|nr:diaminopimelate decarboxylase [Canibacter zhoujuaniae]
MANNLQQPAPQGTRLGELWEVFPENAAATADGVLTLGGVPVTELVAEYGTPLHVFDEQGLRDQAARFRHGLHEQWPNSDVLFASKSLPIVAMYQLAHEEGLAIDIAGGGELQLALAAQVDPERIYFHGNAKTDAEIQMALDAGVGTIIVDNFAEIERLERLVKKPQKVLLRLIPGVDAETHASQATGGNDSKFGLPLDQAAEAIKRMQAHELLQFEGVHLHIGSQILNTHQFSEAVRKISGVGTFNTYDIGGGLGVKYTYEEKAPNVKEYLAAITDAAREVLPGAARVLIEPGRSLVARAGVTLYSVVAVKETGKNFVAIDGGLADQMDVALTGQRYEAVVANKLNEPWTKSAELVGRQCESGDLLVSEAGFPETEVGDIVMMATTGAYSYTMTNNYNGALRPAIVFVKDGEHRLVARRETYEDLLRLHAPALGE